MLCVKATQSCLTLCDPMDRSPPGLSVHGILKEGLLDWVAIPSSRASSQPRDEPRSLALQVDSLPSEPPGKIVTLGIRILICNFGGTKKFSL